MATWEGEAEDGGWAAEGDASIPINSGAEGATDGFPTLITTSNNSILLITISSNNNPPSLTPPTMARAEVGTTCPRWATPTNREAVAAEAVAAAVASRGISNG